MPPIIAHKFGMDMKTFNGSRSRYLWVLGLERRSSLAVRTISVEDGPSADVHCSLVSAVLRSLFRMFSRSCVCSALVVSRNTNEVTSYRQQQVCYIGGVYVT
jgi:hypothetical protein